MSDKNFFDERTEQSRVKAEIVAKYFLAWAKIMIPRVEKRGDKIAYIDLFCGPGRYEDGSKSTPLLVLDKAIADPNIYKRLITVFNDKESNYLESIRKEIEELDGIEKLSNYPQFFNEEVDERLIHRLNSIKLPPSLFFIDPWGYKGLSLSLIESAIKDKWGCDCIFFFNYNRINMGINHPSPKIKEHISSLFSQDKWELLSKEVQSMSSPEHREEAIIKAIKESLKKITGLLPADFCFKRTERTSHYIIFVSKNKTAKSIMQDIMAQYSSKSEEGVPSFQHDLSEEIQLSLPLFDEPSPLKQLETTLLNDFAGQTLTFAEIYERHEPERQYQERNYKDALRNLEKEGKIVAEPPASKRPPRKGEITFADWVKVTFPPKQ